MKKEFLKNITEAHSWIGLIISGLLFVVFFAGSISLFRGEIMQWSMQPHFELSQGKKLPLSEIMAIAIKDRAFDAKEHLTIVNPEQYMPYYRVYADVEHIEGEKDYQALLIDPISGEIVADPGDFHLASFLYELHVDFNIPAGRYVVGFVTLFFFFALISGILIHAKKLISNFFKYRSQQNKRSKLLDMHNVVGVMSLPFTLMYAISGLIFNLVIIYQIAFALVLYQGDQDALLADAGFQAITPQWTDNKWHTPDIDNLYQNIIDERGAEPRLVRMYNYGDESAVIHIFGGNEAQFANRYEVAYSLSNNEIVLQKGIENPNTLVEGLGVIAKLHFGNYAGFDLRLLYFLLGIAVCALIITGNLLWLEKYGRQRIKSIKTLAIVEAYTLWSSGGFVIATACAFVIERILPITLSARADYVVYSFVAALLVVAFLLFFNDNKKVFLAYLLKISAVLLVAVVIIDWSMFDFSIIELWQQGITTVIGTELGLLLMAMLLFYSGNKLTAVASNINEATIDLMETDCAESLS